ncbi:hypothetical protein LSAT2_026936 [Lamellibrachia satsuma]|nr:hypothetical protein LSAT2_026936 [Lamellibrachia satsuma]
MDVVTTGMDVVTTGMDVVTTGMDVIATRMDVVTTGMDVVTTRKDAVTVMCTNNEGSIRKWDKKHYCFYGCEMPKAKFPKHLETIHSEELDILGLML